MAKWREPGAFDELARRAGLAKHEPPGRERELEADAADMRANGDYRVLGSYQDTKMGVTVLVEQNESPNPLAPPMYADAPIVHDPVAVVTGPVGRVAVNLADPDAAEVLERAKRAVTDPDYQRDAV